MNNRNADPMAAQRRDIMRRATLYALTFSGAALLIGVVGAAGIAWLLSVAGMPFMKTWLIVCGIVVLPGLAGGIWKLFRSR